MMDQCWKADRVFCIFVLLTIPVFLVVYSRVGIAAFKPGVQAIVQNLNLTKIPSKPDENKWWFLKDGIRKPTTYRAENGEVPNKDRLIEELMSIPKGYNQNTSSIKKIVYFKMDDAGGKWFIEEDIIRQRQILERCPVNRCSFTITHDSSQCQSADAVFFLNKNSLPLPRDERSKNQVWIFSTMESPPHTDTRMFVNSINWTATYRQDSDIQFPYGTWFPYPKEEQVASPKRNYAANKTRLVAWVVSNGDAPNKRSDYVENLRKHIQVDIYGWVSHIACPGEGEACFASLGTRYKFYLAFENSNCKEYITEKLFSNALGNNMLPIVMGARPQDYARMAPPHSYIHVDDFESPKELAEYLKKVDANDDLYNSYFQWKGTGDFIDHPMVYRMCNVCAKLHEPRRTKTYNNLTDWYNRDACIGPGKWPKNS